MIQVAPNRNQNGLIALAVVVVAVVVFLATYRSLPVSPAATSEPSDVALTSATPSSTSTSTPEPTPTRRPIPTLAPRPTTGPCTLPTSLPVNGADPLATPKVQGQLPGSVLFASPVYTPGYPDPIAADLPSISWTIGLWFVPAPGAEPNLVLSAGDGMVVPLALSPDGREAAVWWWPERRTAGAFPCPQGIYTIDLTDGARSRLVKQGDWSAMDTGEDDVAWNWEDPNQHKFNLPQAAFSFDGSLVALIDGDTIDVVRTEYPAFGDGARHVGSCPQWAWAANANTFVAGCEDLTSAWEVYVVCCDAGIETRSIPILAPPVPADFFSDWESTAIRAIGFTAGGDIRVVRTYGFATGCEGEGECHIPSPAWAVSTIDPTTGTAVHGLTEFGWIFESDPRLSADASWFYAHLAADPPPALTIDLASGTTMRVGDLGTPAGTSLDGKALYAWRFNTSGQAVLRTATRTATKALATISWPDGVVSHSDPIVLYGLWVGAAT